MDKTFTENPSQFDLFNQQGDLFPVRQTRHPGFGYVSLAVAIEDARALHALATRFGLSGVIEPEKMHVTLMYDRSNTARYSAVRDARYRAQITTYDVLGEQNSRWRSVALLLDCPELLTRHLELVGYGMEHSYPTLRPHISVKYRPTTHDIRVIGDRFEELRARFEHGITLEHERWEPVRE